MRDGDVADAVLAVSGGSVHAVGGVGGAIRAVRPGLVCFGVKCCVFIVVVVVVIVGGCRGQAGGVVGVGERAGEAISVPGEDLLVVVIAARGCEVVAGEDCCC